MRSTQKNKKILMGLAVGLILIIGFGVNFVGTEFSSPLLILTKLLLIFCAGIAIFIAYLFYESRPSVRIRKDLADPFKRWVLCARMLTLAQLESPLEYQRRKDIFYVRERLEKDYYVKNKEELFSRWSEVFHPEKTLSALDYCRCFQVWRWAVGAGYITEYESWMNIRDLAKAAQAHFRDWNDYYTSFKESRLKEMKFSEKELTAFKQKMEQQIIDSKSIFEMNTPFKGEWQPME